MIKLYTNKRKRKDIEWIIFADEFFDKNITANKLSRYDLSLMKKLENVELVDVEKNTMKAGNTPFPLTYISTGLKTLLTIRYLKRNNIGMGVDITGCGANVIEYIFEEINDGSIPVVLRHSDLWDLKNDHSVSVNDKTVVNTISDLVSAIIEET